MNDDNGGVYVHYFVICTIFGNLPSADVVWYVPMSTTTMTIPFDVITGLPQLRILTEICLIGTQ